MTAIDDTKKTTHYCSSSRQQQIVSFDLKRSENCYPENYEHLEGKYSKFLSKREKNRKVITFWSEDEFDPTHLQLSGGMPNEGFFPIESIDLNVLNSPSCKINNTSDCTTSTDTDSLSKIHVTKRFPQELPLSMSLQYSETQGMKPLLDFIKTFITKLNNTPPYNETLYDIMLANGSSDSMFKVFETLCDESTTVLMEEFTFVPVISNVMATGAKCIPLKLNLNYEDQGIDIEYLENLLDNWGGKSNTKHLSKPKILYTISTGQNPIGVTLSMEKRRKIYTIAQRHDLIILEDDPYCYLTFPKYNQKNNNNDKQDQLNPYFDPNFTIEDYLRERFYKSLITLDTDGRVIRLETFSKIFGPGLRLSFIVANKFLIDKFVVFSELSSRAPSGVSQSFVYSTIQAMTKKRISEIVWGNFDQVEMFNEMYKSWMDWIMKIAGHYTHRRNTTLKTLYATEAFKNGLFSIIEPSAGMFINLGLQFPKFQEYYEDSFNIIDQMNKFDKVLTKNGVKVVLGYKMAVSKEFSKENCNFIRLTISFAKNDNELIVAANKIAKSIQTFFKGMKPIQN
ncbi:aromatic-amino-acid:2-oxoglutarate transaminase NDAI_0B04550 [Naumovozyma dairenensis CBS 421]|uniref:Aminotransferase class I/classII large domain-containing protein n=1 Tax=Naumovozyma dairenensis (strain ATCC 10597 / BCRC 20456 / CBS 421 / NBRC 0211 / NRRL Y-12639) TaxID=1071378 RepID=G0W6S9_NAUDC|nr:hypothetical protein NDAI_0B04550 [Naumovozyma dairenensis CBS 421]CCD23490.1 hypothetical protein NDAI_0B04550 [Naumovozyma dairenensis CBS 421]